MSVGRLLPALLVAALASVAIAGCGGETTEDAYKDAFPPINRKLVALGNQVGNSIENAGKSTNQKLADDFGGYASELGELKQQLDDLDPPDDLSSDQDALVSAMDAVQGDLSGISTAAKQGDPAAARDATTKLIRDSEKLRDGRRKLAAAVGKL